MASWQGAEHKPGQGRTELAAGTPGHGLSQCLPVPCCCKSATRSIFLGGGKHKGVSTQPAAIGFAPRSNSRWHQEATDTPPAAAMCLHGWRGTQRAQAG